MGHKLIYKLAMFAFIILYSHKFKTLDNFIDL